MPDRYELRSATEADYDFIWRVASVTMREYVEAIWGWDEAWQEQRFRDNFHACPWRVIVVGGQDAGALQAGLRPADNDLCLANIYLLPAFQGRGVGGAVVRSLMREAWEHDLPLSLNVLKSNAAAKRLYERLGLKVVDENDERFYMSITKENGFSLLPENGAEVAALPRWPKKILGAAAVIQDSHGRVLLVKHSYGMRNWEIPGGAVESEESVTDAAVREVFEETGMRVIAERLTGVYYYAENDSHHFVFLCRSASDDQRPRADQDETTDCGYFSIDALPRPISDLTILRIQDALSGLAPVLPVPVGPRQWLE